MTLAQDYLERGYVHGVKHEIKDAVHNIILEHLKPIGGDPAKAKSHAEQFIFDQEVPHVVYAIVESGGIERQVLLDTARLPSKSTWMEWPIHDMPGCRIGILIVDDVFRDSGVQNPHQDKCGFFFVMRTGKGKNDTVSCFGSVAMDMPIDDKASLATAFWKDYVPTVNGVTMPEEIKKDMKAFMWDAIDGLFLIMTPRVCEVRHVEYSGKVNRRRSAVGKLPFVEYKRMVLKVGIGQPRYVSHGGPIADVKEPGYHKRLHRVIGHFRTYRAHREQPLISFVPEHWRGDAELGVVLKTRHVRREG